MSDHNSSGKKLGWFLCWAVVFADIGTSLYYVPGILFGEVHNLAGLFVIMSSIVFVLLVLKYIEITDRYAEGGGVVTVATKAFGPWFGALGGMFITVDYFLTASISAVSGFAYLNSIINLGGLIVLFSIIGIILLGILNVIGIKESAKVTAVIATLAFIVDIALVAFVALQVGPEGWKSVFSSLGQVSNLGFGAILTGFAGSFLAFSGLESISQLSPSMALPRKKVASIAMGFVVAAILITSPLLTLFSTNLLTAKANEKSEETILESVSKVKEREIEVEDINKQLAAGENEELLNRKEVLEDQIKEGKEYSERFISELGAQYGGTAMKIAVVATASVLLLFASNTAIIGAYHVFMALSRQHFLPEFLQKHNVKFDSPHWAVLLAVVPPIIIILVTNGDVGVLGNLYAFGLLGAFGLSSLGLDIVRWREKKKLSIGFVLGIITTVLVFVAWFTNLYTKQAATIFGGGITILGMIIAYFVHRNYMKNEKPKVEAESTKAEELVTSIKQIAKDQIFVPVYDEFDAKVFEFSADLAKKYEKEIVVMYIREFADIYQSVHESISLDKEAAEFITKAKEIISSKGVKVSALYDSSTDTGETINNYRNKIKPYLTILTPHKRSAIVEFIKGEHRIIEKVMDHKNGHVVVYS